MADVVVMQVSNSVFRLIRSLGVGRAIFWVKMFKGHVTRNKHIFLGFTIIAIAGLPGGVLIFYACHIRNYDMFTLLIGIQSKLAGVWT